MSSVEMMSRGLLIQEMTISDIDKKRKLGFLLFVFMNDLFYSIKHRKEHVTSDLEWDYFIEKSAIIFVIEDEEGVLCTERFLH